LKACIFDLDGTLVNTLESLAHSVDLTLKKMRLPAITTNQCKAFVGDGAKVLLEKSIEASGGKVEDRIQEAIDIYKGVFDKFCTYHVTAYQGVENVLLKLKEEGYILGVLSNKPHPQTIKVVKEVFGEDIFDVVYGQREGMRRKPNPEGLEKLLHEIGGEKNNCIYIGDSEVDVKTGKNAGVKTIAVTWGFRDEQQLRKAGADRMIGIPKELYLQIKEL